MATWSPSHQRSSPAPRPVTFDQRPPKCGPVVCGTERRAHRAEGETQCGADGRPNRFHFSVETNGALDPVTLVRAAIWELWKKLDVLWKNLNPHTQHLH
jgi:hypothetical protein